MLNIFQARASAPEIINCKPHAGISKLLHGFKGKVIQHHRTALHNFQHDANASFEYPVKAHHGVRHRRHVQLSRTDIEGKAEVLRKVAVIVPEKGLHPGQKAAGDVIDGVTRLHCREVSFGGTVNPAFEHPEQHLSACQPVALKHWLDERNKFRARQLRGQDCRPYPFADPAEETFCRPEHAGAYHYVAPELREP